MLHFGSHRFIMLDLLKRNEWSYQRENQTQSTFLLFRSKRESVDFHTKRVSYNFILRIETISGQSSFFLYSTHWPLQLVKIQIVWHALREISRSTYSFFDLTNRHENVNENANAQPKYRMDLSRKYAWTAESGLNWCWAAQRIRSAWNKGNGNYTKYRQTVCLLHMNIKHFHPLLLYTYGPSSRKTFIGNWKCQRYHRACNKHSKHIRNLI